MNSRKIAVVMLGIAAYSVVYNLTKYWSGLFHLALLVAIIWACYRALKRINHDELVSNIHGANMANSFVNQQNAAFKNKADNLFTGNFTPRKTSSVSFGVIIGIIAVLAIFTWRFLGGLATYIFEMGDSLNFTYMGSPYIIWAVYGLFLGAIFGAYVAVSKFNLHFKYVLIPIAAFALLLTGLYINNEYVKVRVYEYSGNQQTTDTVTYIAPEVKQRKHHVNQENASSVQDSTLLTSENNADSTGYSGGVDPEPARDTSQAAMDSLN